MYLAVATASGVSSRVFLSVPNFLPSQDFSEDTYRTLAAADNAVMLVDAAKGLEPQTRKLFEVRNKTLRRLFVSNYVNAMERRRHFLHCASGRG